MLADRMKTLAPSPTLAMQAKARATTRSSWSPVRSASKVSAPVAADCLLLRGVPNDPDELVGIERLLERLRHLPTLDRISDPVLPGLRGDDDHGFVVPPRLLAQ